MKAEKFRKAEAYMQRAMQQSVHDTAHVYRVLYAALHIAKSEDAADKEVVALAALLHDIGRVEEEQNPGLHHAETGAAKAYAFLMENGWREKQAAHVRECILTHSYSKKNEPQSLEAKILYDADKLDLTGALGTSRALLFGAQIGEPLYLLGQDGLPTPGKKGEEPSLLREYRRKLKKLHTRFYTPEAARIAARRQKTMDAYFEALQKEVRTLYSAGQKDVQSLLEEG